jgi:hypothetical protein
MRCGTIALTVHNLRNSDGGVNIYVVKLGKCKAKAYKCKQDRKYEKRG